MIDRRLRLDGARMAQAVLAFVALAAIAGWAASFVGLHGFTLTDMTGYTTVTAWLVPGSFDGAAFACSVLVYRASIFGRSAVRGRVLMYGFTLLSGWINWHYQTTALGHWVGGALPFAAVLVFDVVLTDLRAEWEGRHGRQAFRLRLGLLALRWLVDRSGTSAAFRAAITAVPVTDLVGTMAPGPRASATQRADRSDHQAQDRVPAYGGPVPPITSTTQSTVTESQPARRDPNGTRRPMKQAVPPRPTTAPVPPESPAEQTTVIPRIRVDQEPADRTKVHPAGTARRLVSVTAPLDSSATNGDIAAEIAASGDSLSRRQIMATYGVGSGRATTIGELVKGLISDAETQSSAR
jgi:hypothetical protein